MDDVGRARNRVLDNYRLLFVLLLATMVLIAVAGDSGLGRALVLIVGAAAAWLALRASDVQRIVLRLAVAIIPIITAIALILTAFGSDRVANAVTGGLIMLLVVVAPVAMTGRFVRHPVVTGDTFFAAVSVYLLVAMFFATLYSFVATVTGEPFFAQHVSATAVEYLYFSFTTITTTGYGDYTAAGDVGKMTAMIEAIMGQLYLITVVALVVQNLSQERQQRIKSREHERQE
jgi:hypothetical protein